VIWIPVTLAATVLQTARTAMQQRLRSLLSVSAAGFVRYAFGAPIAIAAAVLTFTVFGQSVPDIPWRFWPIVTAAGIGQILGTAALITAFDKRDFAIGTVYAKSEVIQVAVLSALFLDEWLAPLGWLSAIVCIVGVVGLARPPGLPLRTLLRLGDPAALAGVAAGGLFAIASVGIRAASTSLGDAPVVVRALLTLAVMNTIQTVVNGTQLAWKQPDQLRLSVVHWRSSAVVGVLSVLGSAAWAIAMTLENAAKVRTLGQVELLLAFAVSHRVFADHHRRSEIGFSALVMAGVIGVTVLG
jgi:drug/metabolite transporter (DMT)-like permease